MTRLCRHAPDSGVVHTPRRSYAVDGLISIQVDPEDLEVFLERGWAPILQANNQPQTSTMSEAERAFQLA